MLCAQTCLDPQGKAVASALAAASRTGILNVLASNSTPSSADACAAAAGLPQRTALNILQRLVAVGVAERACSADSYQGNQRFFIPEERRGTLLDLGALFDVLLNRARGMEPDMIARVMSFRVQKMLAVGRAA
jgi:hypothetical protein